MNESGAAAFRADLSSGASGIFLARRNGSVATVADTAGAYREFHGLPVVTGRDTVVFRADLKDGGQGVYSAAGDGLPAAIVDTTGRFADLTSFPGANDHGVVAFCARLKSGGAGVFTAIEGRVSAVIGPDDRFASFRAALINNAGVFVFSATPRGGNLGLFGGPDPVIDKIVAIGDPMAGSTVEDFAANPVSLNDAGQVAIRIRLANGRQMIVRADPRR